MPRSARIDLLDGGLPVLEVRVLEQSHQLAVIASVALTVDQERHALLEARCGHAGLRKLFFKAGRQAIGLERAQSRQGGVHHHLVVPHW
jgi:hypothetical protein